MGIHSIDVVTHYSPPLSIQRHSTPRLIQRPRIKLGTRRQSRSLIFLLDATLALGIDKRTASRTSAALTSEEGDVSETTTTSASLGAADMVIAFTADTAAHEEEDCREEHRGPGTPGEAERVAADGGIDASTTELVAGLDEDDTETC